MGKKFTNKPTTSLSASVSPLLKKILQGTGLLFFAALLFTTTTDSAEADQDQDGIINRYDLDDDNDGIPDELECTGISPAGYVSVVNGAFSHPVVDEPSPSYNKSWGGQNKAVLYDADDVPGWSTTASDKQIEIWESGFQNIPAYRGTQFAEINANKNAALYQDVATENGGEMVWSFAHRGRGSKTVADSMRLMIGPPEGPFEEYGRFGTTASGWILYQGEYSVPVGQTTTRFLYEAISTAQGNPSVGNFLDAVRFYVSHGECPLDTDGDGLVNSFDLDSDDDGIADLVEAGGIDADFDGIADDLTDTDGDGLVDLYDSDVTDGPLVSGCILGVDCDLSGSTSILFDPDRDGFNELTGDFDEDGLANWVDLDSDNDGVVDGYEGDSTAHAAGYYPTPQDFDQDGNPDFIDIDADGDGIVDIVEAQPTVGFRNVMNVDDDLDGIDDSFDDFVGFGGTGTIPVNTEGAEGPDFLDLDADNDHVSDEIEAFDLDGDGQTDMQSNGKGKKKNKDQDGDGLDDGFDKNVGKKDATNNASRPMDFPVIQGLNAPSWRNAGGQFPVEWLGFLGRQVPAGVQLNWATATELNSDYFEVQRSADGQFFESVGEVKSAGMSQETQQYQFLDTQPIEQSQFMVYRLKQVDLDGAYEFSKRIEIQVEVQGQTAQVNAFPNPTTGPIRLSWNGLTDPTTAYQIVDIHGRELKTGWLDDTRGELGFDFSTFPAGSYWVNLSTSTGILSTQVLRK